MTFARTAQKETVGPLVNAIRNLQRVEHGLVSVHGSHAHEAGPRGVLPGTIIETARLTGDGLSYVTSQVLVRAQR